MNIGMGLPSDTGPMDGNPSSQDILEMAKLAEQVGFDSVWLVDHFLYDAGAEMAALGAGPPPDLMGVLYGAWEALTTAAGLATATERIEIGYSPEDHQHMINTRAAKVAKIADRIPEQDVFGPEWGDLLVVGWGSTYGAIRSAVRRAQAKDQKVAHAHLRYLNPFPRNLGDLLLKYDKVLVPELNMGQLSTLLDARFPLKVISYPKVEGQPFKIAEITTKIDEVLEN